MQGQKCSSPLISRTHRDKDGLYLYDPNTEKEKVILKLDKDQIFLEEPCHFQNDTLIVGLKGERITGQNFCKDYFSLETKTGKSWLSQQVRSSIIQLIIDTFEYTFKSLLATVNSY